MDCWYSACTVRIYTNQPDSSPLSVRCQNSFRCHACVQNYQKHISRYVTQSFHMRLSKLMEIWFRSIINHSAPQCIVIFKDGRLIKIFAKTYTFHVSLGARKSLMVIWSGGVIVLRGKCLIGQCPTVKCQTSNCLTSKYPTGKSLKGKCPAV